MEDLALDATKIDEIACAGDSSIEGRKLDIEDAPQAGGGIAKG